MGTPTCSADVWNDGRIQATRHLLIKSPTIHRSHEHGRTNTRPGILRCIEIRPRQLRSVRVCEPGSAYHRLLLTRVHINQCPTSESQLFRAPEPNILSRTAAPTMPFAPAPKSRNNCLSLMPWLSSRFNKPSHDVQARPTRRGFAIGNRSPTNSMGLKDPQEAVLDFIRQ